MTQASRLPASTTATYSMEDVKQMLGCEDDAIRGLVQDGLLTSVKIGRSWIFPRIAFDQSLNQLARDDTKMRQKQRRQRIANSQGTPILMVSPVPSKSRRRIPPVLPEV